MSEVKIIVAAHKEYWMPSDPLYLPVQAGAAVGGVKLPYAGDDRGENISAKNPHYCELTCLYWAWKNLKADTLGLVHYRRYFANGRIFGDKRKRILTGPELEEKMLHCSVLLPVPRNYLIETNYSQYAHAHHAADLDLTRKIIAEKHPGYLAGFNAVMQQTRGHRFNMLVMKRPVLDAYCEWLFDILFELEARLDIGEYSQNDARVFGFVGERLLDVWLYTNHISYMDIPYVFLEKRNFIIKGINFIKRKYTAK